MRNPQVRSKIGPEPDMPTNRTLVKIVNPAKIQRFTGIDLDQNALRLNILIWQTKERVGRSSGN
jgi:hypothetical protein